MGKIASFWILDVFDPFQSNVPGKIQNFSTIVDTYALVDVPRFMLERKLCEKKIGKLDIYKFRSFRKLDPPKQHAVFENFVMKWVSCFSSALLKSSSKNFI